METIKLSLGNKLELELYNSNGERISPLLASQYERTLPDGSMEILAPIKGGRIFPVHRGVEMGVIYEKNGELFSFKAEAVERRIAGNIYLLRIMPKSGAEHIQRRFFFRFDCILDLKYRLYEKRDTNNEDRGDYKKAITKDISGGGLCILTKEEPHYGWFIDGVINVGNEVSFTGRVVRVINVHDKGKFNFESGVEFIEISESEREKVISFIFDSQRKLLKKGWSTK
ncbi:MAG: flagellar brake protein [Acetivibrionales bacterium]|jgi:c-di-GMP-binding flagellar brake protein YcgR